MDIGREQEPPRDPPGFGRAIAASVLFHAGVLALVTWLDFLPTGAPAVPEPTIQTSIRLVAGNPQRAPRTEELATAGGAPRVSEELPETAVAGPVPQPLPAETLPEPGPTIDGPAVEETASVDTAGTAGIAPGIDRENLNNAITAFLAFNRSTLLQNWLEECREFRTRHGVADCPEGEEARTASNAEQQAGTAALFKTWVTGRADNARYSEQLLAELDTLTPLMDEDSIVGEIARQRYDLTRTYYCNMNRDNARCTTANITGRFTSPVSDVINILSVGGGGN